MRHLTTLALAGLFVGLLLTGDASACHKKKCPCPPPAPVCAPAPPPVCEPIPVCETKKKCHFKMPKIKFGCHKKVACVPVVYTCPTPVYAAPVYAAPQATGQGS
jgi:hypothetical protein